MQKSTKPGRISVKVAVIKMLPMLQPSVETSRLLRETDWNVRISVKISVKISHLKKSFHWKLTKRWQELTIYFIHFPFILTVLEKFPNLTRRGSQLV